MLPTNEHCSSRRRLLNPETVGSAFKIQYLFLDWLGAGESCKLVYHALQVLKETKVQATNELCMTP
jgi:hypothetical protein